MKYVPAILTVILVAGCGKGTDEHDARRGTADTAQVEEAIAKADRLWETGQKADAVDAYTSLLYGRGSMMALHRYLDGELPKMYRRVIDYKIEVGGLEAGRDDIEDAIGKRVSLSLSTPEANEFVAKVRREFEEAEQEAVARLEARRKAEALSKQEEHDSSTSSTNFYGRPRKDETGRWISGEEAYRRQVEADAERMREYLRKGQWER